MANSIALTGGTGFVGQAVLRKLVASGAAVKMLARTGGAASQMPSVDVIPGNLHDDAALHALTRGCDVVVHLAGLVSAVSTQDFTSVNRDGTVAVAKAAHSNGVKRLVFMSSLAAREPALNGYAASKAAAESALQSFAQDMQILVLRPSAVYGPGDRATLPLLKALLSRVALLPGTDDAVFSMVHVEDLAGAVVDAARGSATGVFGVDDGAAGHSWPELLSITRASFGLPRRAFYLPRRMAMMLGLLGDALGRVTGKPFTINTSQLRQLYHTDWRSVGPCWPLQQARALSEALPDTIAWYQAQGLLPRMGRIDRTQAKTTGSRHDD
jgi:nucleoside-diphosphate-sugar epimerase